MSEVKQEHLEQLTQLAGLWVQAGRDVKTAVAAYKDASGKLANKKALVVELAEKLKTGCTAQISKGKRVTILTDAAKSGAIAVEKGRVVELEKDEVVGLKTEKEAEKE